MARGIAARTISLPAGTTTDPRSALTPWQRVVAWTSGDEGEPCTVWLSSTTPAYWRVRWTFGDATPRHVYVSTSGGGGESIRVQGHNVVVEAVAMDGAPAGEAFAGVAPGTLPRGIFQQPYFDEYVPVNTAGVPPVGKTVAVPVPPWASVVGIDTTPVGGALVSATVALYDARGVRTAAAASSPFLLQGVSSLDVTIETNVAGAYSVRAGWVLAL